MKCDKCPHCGTEFFHAIPEDGGPRFEQESGKSHTDARCRDILAGQVKALRASYAADVEKAYREGWLRGGLVVREEAINTVSCDWLASAAHKLAEEVKHVS